MSATINFKNEYEQVSHNVLRYMNLYFRYIIYHGPHIHSDFEIIILLSGNLHVDTPDYSIDMQAGDTAYININQPHSCQTNSTDPALILLIQISPEFYADYFQRLKNIFITSGNLRNYMPAGRLKAFEVVCFELARDYYEKKDYFELSCAGAANIILHDLLSHLPIKIIPESAYLSTLNYEKRIARIMQYISSHFSEKIVLQQIADMEGLTPSYLSHFFKERLHCSFQKYVSDMRFEKAVYLLSNSQMKIIDICEECGYSDNKYLTRKCLELYNVTPKQFRKKYQDQIPGFVKERHLNQIIESKEDALGIIDEWLGGLNVADSQS